MSHAAKQTPRTGYVTGNVSGGDTFVEYKIPGGRIRVMNSDTLKKALHQTERSIRASIEKIQGRHGVNE